MSDNLLPRIPVTELFPVVEGGCIPAKATENEPFPIRATVFREGHDAYAAEAVLIDPKGTDFSKYKGATLLTPNRSELKEAAGAWANEAELIGKAQKLLEELDLQALLLTRSEEGMSLYEPDHISHQPTRAQEVFDVSGAGDTVIATVGLGLAAKLDLRQAMHIANAAAGVVVAKLGTAVCSQAELLAAFQQDVEAG